MNRFIFLLMLLGSIYMHASDTLKVKKVRFFIEPKGIFYVPIQKHATMVREGYMDLDPIGYGGYYKETNHIQNKTTLNLGISGGLSVSMGKHFNYEVSLSYYHFNVSAKSTDIYKDQFGNYISSETYTGKNTFNFLGIGNGFSYHNKKIIFTNTVLFYVFTYKEMTMYHNNIDNSTQVSTISGNTANHSNSNGFDPFALMTEHKIGYSFYNNRIEPYVGIIFSLTDVLNPLIDNSYHATMTTTIMPFTSIKINF